MSKVKIVFKEGTAIKSYESNSEYGYMQLAQTTVVDNGNSGFLVKRNCLYRGSIELLQAKLEENPTGELPGRIRVVEMHESIAKKVATGSADKNNDIEAVAINELHRDMIKTDYEKAVGGFIKKNPKTDEVLFNNGERILRFQVYDRSGKLEDVILKNEAVSENQSEEIAE
jgi:hypothetical protein